jgi:hypothetical protein
MSGVVRPWTELDNTSLNGVYSWVEGDDTEQAFRELVSTKFQGEVTIGAKTTLTLLSYTFLAVSAWVPFLAALLLLVTTTIAWYAIRARRREIGLLNGVRRAELAAGDLRSFISALAWPAIATSVLLFCGAALAGFGRLPCFAAAISMGLIGALIMSLAVAAIIASITNPSVSAIASRDPAGAHLWGVSAAARVVALIVVALMVPVTVPLVTSAQEAVTRGAAWEKFGNAVTIRIGADSLEGEIESQYAELTRNQIAADNVAYSTSLTSPYLNVLPPGDQSVEELHESGFDSIVMMNQDFLTRLNPTLTETPITELSDLPDSVSAGVGNNLAIWADQPSDLAISFAAADDSVVRVFSGSPGKFEEYARPLVIIIGNPAAFNNQFLTSAVSRGDITFLDSDQLSGDVRETGLSDTILSIDRLTDVGLYETQTQLRGAQLALGAVGLAILAALISIVVNSRIRAIRYRRRIFVERTAGLSWREVLKPVLLREALTSVVLLLVVGGWTALTQPIASALAFGLVSGLAYLAIVVVVHRGATVSAFRSAVVRRD